MKLVQFFSKPQLAMMLVAMLVLCGAVLHYVATRPAEVTSAVFIAPPALIYRLQKKIPPKLIVGTPLRLKIPAINLDTAVDSVGITVVGDMAVPKGPTNVGWFSPGPRPGETGSAVIDGHFGYKDRIPAAFDRLHMLQIGDIISVEDDRGSVMTFVVRSTRTYGPDDDATSIFRSTDGKAHLNLITCQGIWNQGQQSYDTRLVVFTDRQFL